MSESKQREARSAVLLTMECCGSCRFSLPHGPDKVLCRRYPPVPMPAETLGMPDANRGFVTVMSGYVGHFPEMLAKDGWCGEFVARLTVN